MNTLMASLMDQTLKLQGSIRLATTDLIELALKGWKSKERLRPTKSNHHHQSPPYRPMDPYGLCTQNTMKNCIHQLDTKLACKSVNSTNLPAI
ncbi:unnamed protein product [Trichobilharzia regenti]|nr:unnamed protein product [Trichobilharzia regenti]